MDAEVDIGDLTWEGTDMILVENIRCMAKVENAERFLVDREWPKDVVRSIPRREESGQRREVLARVEWVPGLAPSPALWKWFHHDPDKAGLFRNRYFRELRKKRSGWLPIAEQAEKGGVTLLYHGKRSSQTPAHFLKEFLDARAELCRLPAPPRKKCIELSYRGGVAVPVEKAISRKLSRPLKGEMRFKPDQRLTFVSSEKRRVLR